MPVRPAYARLLGSLTSVVLLLACLPAQEALAIPAFTRQYEMSCNTCHAAFPRLNAFGERFRDDMNMRMSNWRQLTTLQTGDEMLALPKAPPFAVRAQAYVQGRDGEEIDPVSGPTGNDADFDFQSPYLIKLLSTAALSEHITFYFYGIFAEKGANGETVIEDAWFRHDDIFGSETAVQLGQFQISDLMFPRETRLTFQDFMVYRMAGITYDRGVLFDRGFGPVDTSLGFVNGNGIDANFNINSPGFRRPDHMFDNDADKTVFARLGTRAGPATIGLFGLSGEQKNATGDAGLESGGRDTDQHIVGLDVSGVYGGQWYWFAQLLWNRWDGFIDPDEEYDWFGAFAGVDYLASDRWAFSLLANYADAGDLDGTDTIYEGIDIRTLTLAASYYFMRNVKGVIEVNGDLLDKQAKRGAFHTGHLTREHYVLVGFDAAF